MICEEAELKAEELGVNLTHNTRKKLGEYDEKSQVNWISNPVMERIIQTYMNQLLASKMEQQQNISEDSIRTNTSTHPEQTKPSHNKPNSTQDDDPEELLGLGLFD